MPATAAGFFVEVNKEFSDVTYSKIYWLRERFLCDPTLIGTSSTKKVYPNKNIVDLVLNDGSYYAIVERLFIANGRIIITSTKPILPDENRMTIREEKNGITYTELSISLNNFAKTLRIGETPYYERRESPDRIEEMNSLTRASTFVYYDSHAVRTGRAIMRNIHKNGHIVIASKAYELDGRIKKL